MKAPKITPGPWEVTQYSNFIGFSIFTAEGCIAERWWPTENRETPIEANAHMLAAAPALAEALNRIFSTCEIADPDAYADARAALLASGYTEEA